MNGRPHYKHEGIGFVPVEHPSQPRGNQCPDAGSTKRRGTKLRSSACRHFSRHDTPQTIGDSLTHAFVRTPVNTRQHGAGARSAACVGANTPTHGIELPHQPGIATPRIRRGYLFDPVVPSQTIDATERRYPALGAYACPGEDEESIGGRNGEHGSVLRCALFGFRRWIAEGYGVLGTRFSRE
jgi:hypothetical protein